MSELFDSERLRAGTLGKWKRNSALTWRYGQTGDVDYFGRPLGSDVVVFLFKRLCINGAFCDLQTRQVLLQPRFARHHLRLIYIDLENAFTLPRMSNKQTSKILSDGRSHRLFWTSTYYRLREDGVVVSAAAHLTPKQYEDFGRRMHAFKSAIREPNDTLEIMERLGVLPQLPHPDEDEFYERSLRQLTP